MPIICFQSNQHVRKLAVLIKIHWRKPAYVKTKTCSVSPNQVGPTILDERVGLTRKIERLLTPYH